MTTIPRRKKYLVNGLKDGKGVKQGERNVGRQRRKGKAYQVERRRKREREVKTEKTIINMVSFPYHEPHTQTLTHMNTSFL